MKWLLIAGLIFAPLSYAQENLNDLLREYERAQDIYRDVYADFRVSQRQYQDTLSVSNQSLYLETSKELGVSRAQVWIAFWQAVRDQLSHLQSYSMEDILTIQDRISETQKELNEHIVNISDSVSLDELSGQYEFMSSKSADYESLAHRSLSYILLARFEKARSELGIFSNTLAQLTQAQIIDDEEQARRMLAIRAVESSLTNMEAVVKNLEAEEMQAETGEFKEGSYDDVREEIAILHTNLALEFERLKELSDGIVY